MPKSCAKHAEQRRPQQAQLCPVRGLGYGAAPEEPNAVTLEVRGLLPECHFEGFSSGVRASAGDQISGTCSALQCYRRPGSGLKITHFRNVTVHSSPKWADLGKMGGNGGKCGKFWMLNGKMGNFGAKKAKNVVLIGNKALGGGCIGESA